MSRFKIIHPPGFHFFDDSFVLLEYMYPPQTPLFDSILDVMGTKVHILVKIKADNRRGLYWGKITSGIKNNPSDEILKLRKYRIQTSLFIEKYGHQNFDRDMLEAIYGENVPNNLKILTPQELRDAGCETMTQQDFEDEWKNAKDIN